MRNRLAIAGALFAWLGYLAFAPPSGGDAHTYVTVKRPVRVCIGVSSALNVGTNGPENTGTHVWYVADSRSDLKPLGLEFVNPLAPSVITSDIYQRWKNRVRLPFNPAQRTGDPAFAAGTPESEAFQIGRKVTKNMGPYWEVNLDTVSDDDLRQFDVVYIHAHKADADFSPDVKQKLMRFMEAGGTLWVENSGRMTFAQRSPFLMDVQFRNGVNGGAGAIVAASNHALLTNPYALAPQDLQNLGDKGVNDYYAYFPFDANFDPAAAPGSNDLNPPAAHTLVPVVWNSRGLASGANGTPNPGWRPYILAGQVGAGRMVVSCQDSGDAINNYVGGYNAGYGGNCAALSGESLIAAHPNDLKFLYNLVTWGASHRTANNDARRTGGTDEKIGAVLEQKWANATAGNGKVGGAVFYKNCVYVVDGSLILHCYNANPAEDLDGDDNPDEGLPDFIAGAGYDEIWRLDLNAVSGGAATGASTPTVVEFYDPNFSSQSDPTVGGFTLRNNNQRDLLVVVLSNGAVVGVRAQPRTVGADGRLRLAPVTTADWSYSLGVDYTTNAFDPGSFDEQPIPSAAWSEGVVFVALNTTGGGRVAAIDPRAGRSALVPGANGYGGNGFETCAVPDVPNTAPFWSSPTVGYVRDDLTGALDRTVYVQTASSAGKGSTIQAYWFGSRSEPLAPLTSDSFRSRADRPWFIYDVADKNPALRQRVFCTFRDPASGLQGSVELKYRAGGEAIKGSLNQNEYSAEFKQNQQRVYVLNVQVQGGPAVPANDARNTFHADYALDWSPANPAQPKVIARSTMQVADPQSLANKVGGAAALAGDDLAIYTADTSGGNYPGKSVLYGVREQSGNQTAVKWSYVFHDGFSMQDPQTNQDVVITPRLRQLDPAGAGYGEFLYNVRVVGTPATRSGVVYAVARANIGSSSGPETSVLCAFRAEPELVLRLPFSVSGVPRIRQLNLFNSQAGVSWIELTPQQYRMDVGAESTVIRIDTMSPRGNIGTNFLSCSLPWEVRFGANTYLIAPTRADVVGGNRSARSVGAEGVDNLLWYQLIPGTVTTSPSAQGDVVWVGTQIGGDGWLASLDADPASRNPDFQANGNQVIAAPRWLQRVGSAPLLAAPGGAANVLAVNTAQGTQAFEDTLTVVADSRRIIEVNAAGDATWSSDGTRSFGIAGGGLPQYAFDPGTGNVIQVTANTGVPAVQKVPFSRPAVVKRVGVNDLLVVDTGHNRVAQIDRGGNTRWELNRVQDDWRRLLRPGDPTTLNAPTDCTVWNEFVPVFQVSTTIGGTTYTYNGPAFVVHYLIADSGNFRVLEVVDAYDAFGRPVRPSSGGNPAPFSMIRQLRFASSTYAVQNKRYDYLAAQRLVVQDSILPPTWQTGTPLRQLTLTTVGSTRLVDPQVPFNAASAVGEVVETAGGSVAILKEDGAVLSVVNTLRVPEPDPNNAGNLRTKLQPISKPTYFSQFVEVDPNTGQPAMKFLLCDQNGCYQARISFVNHATSPSFVEPVMDVEWLITAEDYFLMTGKRLQATGIRRLANAAGNAITPATPALREYLISNRFSGEDNPSVFGLVYNVNLGNPNAGNIVGPGEFRGEVFVLRPATFNLLAPAHGYIPDFSVVAGAFLWPNDGQIALVNNNPTPFPQASIVKRIPSHEVPRPPSAVVRKIGDGPFAGTVGVVRRSIGSPDRATSAAVLEQPTFADRPF